MTVYTAVKTRTGNCSPFATASDVIHLLGFVAAEGLLIIRTYAFWQCNKKMLVGLLIFAAAMFTAAVVESSLVDVPAGFSNPGDCIFADSRDSSAQYVFLLVFELVVLCLTLVRGAKIRRSQMNQLITMSKLVITLYRDGVFYVCCIILLSLTNIITIFSVPIAYTNSLVTLQLVLHSVLASRILFHLRESNEQSEFDSLPLVYSVHFAIHTEDDLAEQPPVHVSPRINRHW